MEMQRKIIHRTKGGCADFQEGEMRHTQPGKESGGERVVRAISHCGFSKPLWNLWELHRFQRVSPAVPPACSMTFQYIPLLNCLNGFLVLVKENTDESMRVLCCLPACRLKEAISLV